MTLPADRSLTRRGSERSARVKSGIVLAIMIALPLAVGFLGSLATRGNVDGWYAQAIKAPWTPPNAVFGPMWSALYVLMGIAAWFLWRKRHLPQARKALGFYWLQLVCNALWTPLFFAGYPVAGTPMLWLAFADIMLLILTLAACMTLAARVSRAAPLLLLPLLLWVSYASTLNAYLALYN